MATIILVAHGSQRSGSFSNAKVKIITKAGQPLSFDDAKNYLNGGNAPEFSSSSLGDFSGLSDADCRELFGRVPGEGPGYVNTGKHRGDDMNGYQIFALRGQESSFADIGLFAQGYDRVILVACRN
ncbi:MAG: hypothetical protein WBL95_18280 [Microcoleus sp.]